MNQVNKKKKRRIADDFSISEKVIVIYLGLSIAKEIFFTATEIAFLQKKISARSKKQWETLFMNEFNSCRKIEIQTYNDCVHLEFKVRHLMDLALNISFDLKEPWQAFSVPFQNVFFPILTGITFS